MSHNGEPHVIPLKHYIGVFLALMVLTAVTVGVSYFDFGAMNMVVAMSVATVKATLVALIFMHLWYDDKFNLTAFLGSFVFVALFFIFTFADVTTRGQYDDIQKNYAKPMPPPPTAGNLGKKPDHGAGHSTEGAAPATGGH